MSLNSRVDKILTLFTENQEGITDTYITKKTKLKCNYCNYKYKPKRENGPAFGQLCKMCKK